jgi:hypothetical protein
VFFISRVAARNKSIPLFTPPPFAPNTRGEVRRELASPDHVPCGDAVATLKLWRWMLNLCLSETPFTAGTGLHRQIRMISSGHSFLQA